LRGARAPGTAGSIARRLIPALDASRHLTTRVPRPCEVGSESILRRAAGSLVPRRPDLPDAGGGAGRLAIQVPSVTIRYLNNYIVFNAALRHGARAVRCAAADQFNGIGCWRCWRRMSATRLCLYNQRRRRQNKHQEFWRGIMRKVRLNGGRAGDLPESGNRRARPGAFVHRFVPRARWHGKP